MEFTFAFQVCGVNSSFIITSVTLERYLAICFPLKSAPWRTKRRAKVRMKTIVQLNGSIRSQHTVVKVSYPQNESHALKTFALIHLQLLIF